MNATNPPSLSGASAPPAPAVNIHSEPPVRLARLLLGLTLAVAIFDLCFWDSNGWGISVAFFFTALAGIVLGNREPTRGRRMTRLLLTLFAGALVAATIETGVTNTIVLLVVIIAIAGDTFFVDIESASGRWHSQAVALIFAPGRIFWLGGRLMEAAFGGGLGWTGGLIGGCLLAVPALVLALIFGSLLASGNAVFGSWTNSFSDWFWKELALYLNPERMVLWCFAAFLILPLLRPANVSAGWWKSPQQIPRFAEIIPTYAALFSSGLILVVLNVLFFIANMADALFLWSGQTLPSGVNYSGYVHDGVDSLIVTAILSAFVLTGIFQQALQVAGRRVLKVLAIVWIAQNLFLLLSVALRLKLYIEAYDMTVTRLSVMIFLALVAGGYALLTVKIMREKSLSWLLGGCVLAIFATFYVTQFLDLAGWSANYNVARWEEDTTRRLDYWYLGRSGPGAWPALNRAYEFHASNEVTHALIRHALENAEARELKQPQAVFDCTHWREFSLRAWRNRWALDDKK